MSQIMKELAEAELTKIAGAAVKLTVRSKRTFTLSTERVNKEAAAKLAELFEGRAVEVVHDEECGSFVLVEVINGGE